MAAKKKTGKKTATTKRSGGKRASNRRAAKRTPAKAPKRAPRPDRAKRAPTADVPSLFRINVEVGNLAEAAEFYAKLFGVEGRVQAGSRVYFTCGAVTL